MPLRPRLVERPLNQNLYQQALQAGLHPLQARILAGRTDQVVGEFRHLIQPSLQSLAAPQALRDFEPGIERLVQAIQQKQRIGLLTDYDVDGITAHAVLLCALRDYFAVDAALLSSWIGHRMQDGYGISDSLVDRLLAADVRPDLIITADCGSSDEPRIARLKAAGIDVLVTDHHALPVSGPPPSACAVINPTRQDCDYPDSTLAGCAVAWLLMAGLRQALIHLGRLPADAPKLRALLPWVALGTMADCVSLGGSAMNRSLIHAGLQVMNASNAPSWQAFRELMGTEDLVFTPEVMAFQLGPRINARSRMADPYAALRYLLAEDLESARHWLQLLDEDNLSRRAVEAEMVEAALQAATEQVQAGHQGLVAFLPQGHPGVQGIVASRLVERWGRPTVVLTPHPQEPQHLSASGRSILEVHLRDALQWIDDQHPGWLVRFGGHQGAAGLTLRKDRLADFQRAFQQALKRQLGEQVLSPLRLTDGSLDESMLCLATCDLIEQLQPYGRDFESPVFSGEFRCLDIRPVGQTRRHLKLRLETPNRAVQLDAIWFNALPQADSALPLQVNQLAHLAYRLEKNHFRGQTSLQLQLVQLAPNA